MAELNYKGDETVTSGTSNAHGSDVNHETETLTVIDSVGQSTSNNQTSQDVEMTEADKVIDSSDNVGQAVVEMKEKEASDAHPPQSQNLVADEIVAPIQPLAAVFKDPRLKKQQGQDEQPYVDPVIVPHVSLSLAAQPEPLVSVDHAIPVYEIPKTLFYRLITEKKFHVSNIIEVNVVPAPGKDGLPVTPVGNFPTSINSLDVSPDGNLVAASTLDNNIILMSIDERHPERHIMPVQKYGANHVTILSSGDQAITSSTKTNNDLRMLSFANPKEMSYVRYFKGHTNIVCSLSVSEDGRNIISAAAFDKKVFLWDVLIEKPVGVLNLSLLPKDFNIYPDDFYGPGWKASTPSPKPRLIAFPQPVVTFDPSSLVFAVMSSHVGNNEVLKMFDIRNYSKGPFLTVNHDFCHSLLAKYPKNSDDAELKMSLITALSSDFNDLKFSPDGKYLVVNTNGPLFYILDALTGELINVVGRKYRQYNNTFPHGICCSPEVSFSPDSQFIVGGNGDFNDPRLYIWSVETGEEVAIVNKDAKSNTNNPNFGMNFVKFNPRFMSLVTAGGRRISVYEPLPFDDEVDVETRQRRDSI